MIVLPLALAAGPLGITAAGAATPSSTPAPNPPGPSVPALNWTNCGDTFECATARVPLDHTRPTGPSITIALTRLPASDPAHRIGSLFINPGGPGGSGTELVRAAPFIYSDQVRARFDVVGFDPRFLGASRPLATCATDQEFVGAFGRLPLFPITKDDERAVDRAYKDYNRKCAKRSPFLAYGSTADVARDLDLLRQAVGDPKLNYAGYSYGTMIGQTYAALFPDKLRSMTLDGVIDAQLWSTGAPGQDGVPFSTRLGSAAGSDDAFAQFTRLCDEAGPAQCGLAGSIDAKTKFAQLAARLKTDPLVLPDDQGTIDYSVLVSATLNELYQPLDWGWFSEQLQTLYDVVVNDDGDFAVPAAGRSGARAATAGSSPGLVAAEAVVAKARAVSWTAPFGPKPSPDADPGPGPGPAFDNDQALSLSVACSDSLNPRSEHAWAKTGAEQDQLYPYFGRAWTWQGEGCATWQLPGNGAYLGPYDQATSAPVLVVGNRHDPATPYLGARTVADRLPGARLLTVNGYGHTSLAMPSACATAVFDAYLIGGTLPAVGTTCGQDVAPFTPY